MISFVTSPSSLSLVGNMTKYVVSGLTAEVVVTLSIGSTVSVAPELVRTYTPDSDGHVEVDMKEIVESYLQVTLRMQDTPYEQSLLVRTFTVGFTSGTDTATHTFTAVKAGVDQLADTAANFLAQNFLTWQPSVKGVTYYTPEFLTYYAQEQAVVKCRATIPSTTQHPSPITTDLTLATIPAGKAYTIPVTYNIIAGKTNALPSYYDIWIENGSGQRLTYIQRYFAQDMRSEQEQWVLFENSLGGIDTFRAYGDCSHEAAHTYNVAEIDEVSIDYRIDTERKFKKSTGRLDQKERRWLLDFFPSRQKYIYIGQSVRQIVVTESDAAFKASTLPSAYTFTYKYADAKPYLNLPRTDVPQEVLNIQIPDVASFTVAPRLVEFQRIPLSDGALFPIQEPYSERWGTTTFGQLAAAVFNAVIGFAPGQSGGYFHVHSNLDFLENLSWESIKNWLSSWFVSKVNDDTVAGKITFNNEVTHNGAVTHNDAVTHHGAVTHNNSVTHNDTVTFNDDVTHHGDVTHNGVVTHNEIVNAKGGVKIGNFQSRLLGYGALIDEDGNAEFESIYSRNFISTPEFRFNRVAVTEGENWNTNGFGTIQEVKIIDNISGYITLKLEENDYASVENGDICRGIYNDIANDYGSNYSQKDREDDSVLYTETSDAEGNGFGFSTKMGFFTSYFHISQLPETGSTSQDLQCYNLKGACRFKYTLRKAGSPHPCAFMKFAQYGSFTNANRRSSSYSTSIGHYYEMVLDGVNTWKIKSANVVLRKGWLGDMTVTLRNGGERTLQGYGLYVQDNVYFGSAIVQIDPQTLADLEEELSQYDVNLSGYVDVITVDDTGNCIGGLWTVSGANNEYRNYRIHSAITVKKNNVPLTIAAANADAGTGTYKIYTQPRGCTCVVENSTICITGIDNIKDGVAGSQDDANFDYDAMREMDSCGVDIIIDCEGKGTIQKSFPIRIKHQSQPFIGAHISNEFSGISWNTQTQAYVGLPIVFDITMWHNNEVLDIASANDISLSTGTSGVTLINGIAPIIPAASSIYYIKNVVTIVKNQGTADEYSYKAARITITAVGSDVPLVTNINVTTTAIYSGVSYERTLVHTINKSTDTNVYSLLPSDTEIVLNSNTGNLNSNVVTCSVICDSSDDKHYSVAYNQLALHGLALYYRLYYTDGTQDGSETAYAGTDIQLNSSIKEVKFFLYGITNGSVDRTIVHDEASVNIIPSGLDGKGVEYIFFVTNSWDETDANKPTIYDVAAERQVDNYCPYTDQYQTDQWTDEPTGVGANNRFEFYAQRKKVNGVWQPFGAVKLWNRYAVDGVSSYLLDLSNENSLVNCDANGNVIGTYESTSIILLRGDEDVFSQFTIFIAASNISCTVSQDGKTITPSNITANNASITVTAKHNTHTNVVLTAVYKINKTLQGSSGVIYSLKPLSDIIHMDGSGAFIDTSLQVNVKKVVGNTTTLLETFNDINGEGLTLKYLVGASNAQQDFPSNSNIVTTSAATGNGTYLYTTILLIMNGTVIDRERIHCASDGEITPDFFIIANPDSVTIQADATQATYEGYINLFRRDGDNAATPYQAYSRIFVRKNDGTRRIAIHGGNITGYGSIDQNQPISITVNDDDDAIEVYGRDTAIDSTIFNDHVVKKEIIIHKKGDTGGQGYRGCRSRLFTEFHADFEYHNDEATPSNNSSIVDFFAVEDSNEASGYKVYKCKTTHTPNEEGYVTFNADKNAGNWETVSVNAASAFFTFLIAKSANIKMLASSQLVIEDADANVVAGLGNTDIPLWAGGSPDTAPFRVTRAGALHATDADIEGTVRAKNLYHGVCVVGKEVKAYCSASFFQWYSAETYVNNFTQGKYYTKAEVVELSGGDLGDFGDGMIKCTYDADIVVVPNLYNNSYAREVKLPAAKDFEGKIVEVIDNAYTNGQQIGDILVSAVDGGDFANGIGTSGINFSGTSATLNPGGMARFYSIRDNNVWYWLKLGGYAPRTVTIGNAQYTFLQPN